jgi:hypothetical protein
MIIRVIILSILISSDEISNNFIDAKKTLNLLKVKLYHAFVFLINQFIIVDI